MVSLRKGQSEREKSCRLWKLHETMGIRKRKRAEKGERAETRRRSNGRLVSLVSLLSEVWTCKGVNFSGLYPRSPNRNGSASASTTRQREDTRGISHRFEICLRPTGRLLRYKYVHDHTRPLAHDNNTRHINRQSLGSTLTHTE